MLVQQNLGVKLESNEDLEIREFRGSSSKRGETLLSQLEEGNEED